MSERVRIPDIGTDEDVEVIEINIKEGDELELEQGMMVLESDKASMEIPSPVKAKVLKILVEVGAQVKAGQEVLEVELLDNDNNVGTDTNTKEQITDTVEDSHQASAINNTQDQLNETITSEQTATQFEKIFVPDIGSDTAVEVIEVQVNVGDQVAVDQGLVVLESDKASMEVPAPKAGTIKSIHLQVGEQVKAGALIVELQSDEVSAPIIEQPKVQSASNTQAQPVAATEQLDQPKSQSKASIQSTGIVENRPSQQVYAGPAVRLLARELGVDLAQLQGSGPKDRILKEDVQRYVKQLVQQKTQSESSAIPELPAIDFEQFGETRVEPASRLHKLTASNMHRSWLNVPHVTQFDELDVTELEAFRKEQASEAEKRGVKLTPLAFIFKALALTLKESPKLNASLSNDGQSIIYKKYVHIGMAVDTPQGLVVPVIRDVDQKSIWQLAKEIAEVAEKARDKKLRPNDMQGGCFTVSSLGSIGGTGFTPIVNAPEVAILGISKLDIKPVWNEDQQVFLPHKVLPVSLSYDHRAINGADAGRFLLRFNQLVVDLRQLALIG